MWLRLDQPYKSLTPFGQTDLPNLVVVSGENGAGKTHLLQGIVDQRVAGDWAVEPGVPPVRYMTSEQLGNPAELQSGNETREQLVARFESTIQGSRGLTGPAFNELAQREANLQQNLQTMGLSPSKLLELRHRSGRPLIEWTHDDCVYFAPNELGGNDLFGVSVGDIFGRYNQLVTANDLEHLRAGRGEPHAPLRTPEEIREVFGLPPWELLNIALASVGLPYRFERPATSMLPLAAPPSLMHTGTGASYPVSALSSGEKTLLSIALSAYSAGSRRDYLRLPQVVLLDEPDATLHPSMIKSLLQLLQEQFSRDLQIRVIITTHSPTTVALAPDDSLFIMRKSVEPRLRSAPSKDAALASLLVGVPTISVRAEHRRIVVVESPNDERRYTKLRTLLDAQKLSERSLVFMAAGSSHLPDGSAAVIDLVTRLRANGNTAVWGLVDRDNRVSEPSEFVLMNNDRYTSENLILDPLAVGLLLLLEAFQPTVAALDGVDYVRFDAAKHAQSVVDHVVQTVGAAGGDDTSTTTRYVDETAVNLPRYWSDEPGHDLTRRLCAAFPILRRYEREPDRLLEQIIDRVWTSRPGLIPASIANTFSRLLDAI